MASTEFVSKTNSNSKGNNLIKLKSVDDVVFEVEERVARTFKTISNMLDHLDDSIVNDGEPIPLPNVDGSTLKLIIEWANHHKDDPASAESGHEEIADELHTVYISKWDGDFLGQLALQTLVDVFIAANYLEVHHLNDTCAKIFASKIEAMTNEEIRTQFDIQNDLTIADKEECKKKYPWVQ